MPPAVPHRRAPRPRRAITATLLATVAFAIADLASGAEEDDGAYGRLEGDLGFALELGVSEAFPGESLAARLGCHYLHTVGIFGQYDDGLGGASQPTARSMAVGVDVRPLFLARFASDLERGPALLDLWLDSLSLNLATVARWMNAGHCSAPTERCWQSALQLGTGMELSLLAQAESPFVGLHGALRWPITPAGFDGDRSRRPNAMVTLTLGYRLVVAAHLVDAADRAR